MSEQIENKDVSSFYDEFSSFQQGIAFNERHFYMLDKMLELGLNGSSNVLELGCGIGVITSLINKVVKKGKIVSADISPQSIALAKEKLPNIEFHVADVTEFESKEVEFDFITLFDVLEHIPLDAHSKLFKTLASHMKDHTKLLINIPNPDFLDYMRAEHPETLQIIDNSLQLVDVINSAKEFGIELISFEKYDLWHRHESEFLLFEKRPFEMLKATPPKQSFWRRVQNKFEFYW